MAVLNAFQATIYLHLIKRVYYFFFIYNCIRNKISPNNGTLLNGVLRSKLLNIPFASWFLINFEFLAPHTAHFHNNIVLPLLVSETVGFMFSVFFLHFEQ